MGRGRLARAKNRVERAAKRGIILQLADVFQSLFKRKKSSRGSKWKAEKAAKHSKK